VSPHIVSSSVGDADKETDILHFESKFKNIKEHLKACGIPYIITAPAVYFMVVGDIMFALHAIPAEHVTKGNFPLSISADTKLQQVSVRDIGLFNSIIILSAPEKYTSNRID
jgi:uncharacterized protein YbjT (DUF2867 family)